MEAEFWHRKWQRNEIGFHRAEIHPALTGCWEPLAGEDRGPVLVPLCGKSLDMLWLREQGHQVLGVEINELAVQQFFSENGLDVEKSRQDDFTVWETEGIRLFCGDFFSLEREQLSDVQFIYDRAALIALPQEMREHYARHLSRILPDPVRGLLVTLVYEESELEGPPFSVREQEVRALFGERFHLERVAERDGLERDPGMRDKGLSSLSEQVFRLEPHGL